ncbi:MAG: hypothetical protein ABI707_12360 [Ferruginibacter sp.]
MKKNLTCSFALLFLFTGAVFFTSAQKPDLSVLNTREEKVQSWLSYCEGLKMAGFSNNAPTTGQSMGAAADEGLLLISPNDLSAHYNRKAETQTIFLIRILMRSGKRR